MVSGIGLVLGDAACYVLGTAWFVFQMQCDLGYALAVCVYPFIALDLRQDRGLLHRRCADAQAADSGGRAEAGVTKSVLLYIVRLLCTR